MSALFTHGCCEMGLLFCKSALMVSPEPSSADELCGHVSFKRTLPDACRAILNALTARWPATRYAIVHQKFTKWTMPLILPPRWVDYLVASHLKLLPSVENKQPEMSSRLARQKAA